MVSLVTVIAYSVMVNIFMCHIQIIPPMIMPWINKKKPLGSHFIMVDLFKNFASRLKILESKFRARNFNSYFLSRDLIIFFFK